MSKKESRITRIPERTPVSLRPTMPYVDYTKRPEKKPTTPHKDYYMKWENIVFDGSKLFGTLKKSKKLKPTEPNKIQCKARVSDGKLILDTDFATYTLEPLRKLRNLLNGRVKSTRLIWTKPMEIDWSKVKTIELKTPIHLRRFVRPSRTLTPEEEEEYRYHGLIPLDRKRGDWTRGREIHFDKQTLQELEEGRKFLEEKTGQKLNFNEMVRLMVLRGLEALKEEMKEEALKKGSTEATSEVSESSEETSKEG